MENKIQRIKENRTRSILDKSIKINKSSARQGIIIISTYPPKVCGIASYTEDLRKAINEMFNNNYDIFIGAIVNDMEDYKYSIDVDFLLNTNDIISYLELAQFINNNKAINTVLLQHEFGLYENKVEGLNTFLSMVKKDVITTFHTVLGNPSDDIIKQVKNIAGLSKEIIVMTHQSSNILTDKYDISPSKISVIPHGTHLNPIIEKKELKEKYQLKNSLVLSTFGLIGPGKSIETTLFSLPEVILQFPNVKFLVIGKTHPNLIKTDGESYRESLMKIVRDLKIEENVIFINQYLPLPDLIEYLQLTDIYLFTSKDRNQAVSGTFAYALSCGCPIITTPIPHAIEILNDDIGKIINFESVTDMITALNYLLKNKRKRDKIRLKAYEKMSPTAWQNSAVKHVFTIKRAKKDFSKMSYNIPPIKLDHIKKMTTSFGILQFSNLSIPDQSSGYTLDDNARALIAFCQLYQKTRDEDLIRYIQIYLNFIKFCQKSDGDFYNYVNYQRVFSLQNEKANLEDSNGRAIWALGTVISMKDILPRKLYHIAEEIIDKNVDVILKIKSPRAIAFIIKGLYHQNSTKNQYIVKLIAIRLKKYYENNNSTNWKWFEEKLTYANSILPEAMLYAWKITNFREYKDIAIESFEFLLSKIYINGEIHPISNKNWDVNYSISSTEFIGGEQPIDVAYTIMSLDTFYKATKKYHYKKTMINSFFWYLGNNHLSEIVYNPITGGCYDGIEKDNINLNQGAESSVCYLLARLNFN